MWGLIGLVIIFGAYGIINVALGTFGLDQYKSDTSYPVQKVQIN